MIKAFCLVFGALSLAGGLAGTFTGGHDHVVWGFGLNVYHNVLHEFMGITSLAMIAAGPRHARIFCLAVGSWMCMLALGGSVHSQVFYQVLNLHSSDVWVYALAGVTALTAGLTSAVPLRLRAAVDMPPITWA